MILNELDVENQVSLEKNIVKVLETEKVAYDIGSYRSAPPGLRIWGGPTINPKDIKLLLPWLQWAFEECLQINKKGTKMAKVLISDKISESAIQIFKNNKIEVDYKPGISEDELNIYHS